MSETIDEAGLRALCEAATPGPWEMTPEPDQPIGLHVDGDSLLMLDVDKMACVDKPADARFIAAARTAVPALLDLVASLRAVIAEHLPHQNGPGKTTPGDANAWTAAMWNIGNQHERAEKAEKERDEALAKLSAVHDRVASVLHMAGLPYAARYELEQVAPSKEES